MRLSEFWIAMTDEFGGPYGRALAQDLTLTEVEGLTAQQAISAGYDPRDIWLAICRAADVPADRWYGVGMLPEG